MDFKSKPYSEWLDRQIVELYKHDPKSIAIAFITKDDEIGTCYFGTDTTDILRMIDTMDADRKLSWIEVNADLIRGLLERGEED